MITDTVAAAAAADVEMLNPGVWSDLVALRPM